MEQKQSSRKALWIRRKAPMPYVQAHCSSLPENLSYLQEKFDLELEQREKCRKKGSRKKLGKDQNRSGF